MSSLPELTTQLHQKDSEKTSISEEIKDIQVCIIYRQ